VSTVPARGGAGLDALRALRRSAGGGCLGQCRGSETECHSPVQPGAVLRGSRRQRG
jgi:hypothetical protein